MKNHKNKILKNQLIKNRNAMELKNDTRRRRCGLVERVIGTAGCNDGYQANDQ